MVGEGGGGRDEVGLFGEGGRRLVGGEGGEGAGGGVG